MIKSFYPLPLSHFVLYFRNDFLTSITHSPNVNDKNLCYNTKTNLYHLANNRLDSLKSNREKTTAPNDTSKRKF